MISFIIPAKNVSTYIEQALQPFLQGKSSDWELIIIEDHSTDKSFELISKLIEEHEAISVYRNSGVGKVQGLNMGLEKAKGQADATRDAGVEPRQQQPLTKAPKASGRKPFKPAKPATKASGKNARGKK